MPLSYCTVHPQDGLETECSPAAQRPGCPHRWCSGSVTTDGSSKLNSCPPLLALLWQDMPCKMMETWCCQHSQSNKLGLPGINLSRSPHNCKCPNPNMHGALFKQLHVLDCVHLHLATRLELKEIHLLTPTNTSERVQPAQLS